MLKYSIVDISYSQNGIDTGQNGPPQDSNERFPTKEHAHFFQRMWIHFLFILTIMKSEYPFINKRI